MQDNTTYRAGLYLRLSKDDEQQGESVKYIGHKRIRQLQNSQLKSFSSGKSHSGSVEGDAGDSDIDGL